MLIVKGIVVVMWRWLLWWWWWELWWPTMLWRKPFSSFLQELVQYLPSHQWIGNKQKNPQQSQIHKIAQFSSINQGHLIQNPAHSYVSKVSSKVSGSWKLFWPLWAILQIKVDHHPTPFWRFIWYILAFLSIFFISFWDWHYEQYHTSDQGT